MSFRHARSSSRRSFLGGLTLAGTAGALGLLPRRAAAEPGPETTRLRLLPDRGHLRGAAVRCAGAATGLGVHGRAVRELSETNPDPVLFVPPARSTSAWHSSRRSLSSSMSRASRSCSWLVSTSVASKCSGLVRNSSHPRPQREDRRRPELLITRLTMFSFRAWRPMWGSTLEKTSSG